MSYCSLLKFSFQYFSLLYYKIFFSNLAYELVFTKYKSSLSFVALDLLLHEFLSFLSVSNYCVFELFGGVFVLSLCPFDISVDIMAFVIGLSQVSSFFLFLN